MLIQDGRQVQNVTGADLSRVMGSVTSRGGVNVSFFWYRVRIDNSESPKNGMIETRLGLSRQPKGDPSTVSMTQIDPEVAARDFPTEWALFEQYQTVPTTGTPLHEVPGLSQSDIGRAALHGLRSAEDFEDLGESAVHSMGIDGARIQKVCQAFLRMNDENSEQIASAEEVAKLEARLAEMQRQIQDLTRNNVALTARAEAMATVAQPVTAPAAPTMAGAVTAQPAVAEGTEDLPSDISQFDDYDLITAGPDMPGVDEDLVGDEVDPLQD